MWRTAVAEAVLVTEVVADKELRDELGLDVTAAAAETPVGELLTGYEVCHIPSS